MMRAAPLIVALLVYIAACVGIIYALSTGGLRLLFVCAVFISAAFLGWLLWWLYTRSSLSFSHIIVAWLVVNGTCLLWGVMYLAATGADNIAETLGRYVVTELLGTVGGSLVKSLIENLSINNTWPDKNGSEVRDL